MDIVRPRFNFYLLAVLCAGLVGGCATKKEKKLVTTLRVHAEASDNTTFKRKIKLFERDPFELSVDQSTLLTDADVESAAVVEALGGFAFVVNFNKRGQWLLDQHSSLNLGRHLAIFVQYGPKSEKARWLAAPIISNRISDGALIFTPDCTREEADQIANGLGAKPSAKKQPKEEP